MNTSFVVIHAYVSAGFALLCSALLTRMNERERDRVVLYFIVLLLLLMLLSLLFIVIVAIVVFLIYNNTVFTVIRPK